MIKISKKAAFIFMIIMCMILVIYLREINWDNLKSGKDVFREIKPSIAAFIVTIIFFVLYMKRLKEEQGK